MSKSVYFVFLVFSSILVFPGCKETVIGPFSGDFSELESFTCSAENTENGWVLTSAKGIALGGSAKPSLDKSKTGKHSFKLGSDATYGIVLPLKNLTFNNSFTARFWRAVSQDEVILMLGGDHYQEAVPTGNVEDGWEEMELHYRLSKDVRGVDLVLQAAMRSPEKVGYFDDLSLEIHNTDRNLDPADAPKGTPLLSLEFDERAMQKLRAKRDSALKIGILQSSDDDWVNGVLDNDYAIEARLKGDWTDHLEGDKWSMRIELPKGQFWKRMRKFSIQSPATRNMLSEWVLHELYRKEDILTTRFHFTHVELNGEPKGVYAVEEHFTKQLLETQQRREGPILKWNEDHLWKMRAENPKNEGKYPWWASTEITQFSAKKYKRDPKLYPLMEAGRNLLWSAQHNLLPAEEIYDLERMGTYMAIQELFYAYHGSVWHNMRFYYNPVTAKLEPVAFDGDSKLGMQKKGGAFVLEHIQNTGQLQGWEINLYKNERFVNAYAAALKRLGTKEYLDAFFAEIEGEMSIQLDILLDQFPDYTFDFDWVRAHGQELQNYATKHPDSNTWIKHDYQGRVVRKDSSPLNNVSVRCYELKVDDEHKEIAFANYLPCPVVISKLLRGEKTFLLDPPIKIAAYNGSNPAVSERRIVPFNPKKFVYTASDFEGEHIARSIPLALPEKYISPLEGMSASLPSWAVQEDDFIRVKKGKHTLSSALIIPHNKTLSVEAGTMLTLESGGFIYSAGALSFLGTENEPILIEGKEGNLGVSVMNASETSVLKHVVFNGLRNFQLGKRTMTGAVTFYEAYVEMSHCTFSNNKSEDGLNIIRSHFELNHCKIVSTTSDGFDADFCTGTAANCTVSKTGNDGFDFSGSEINIKNCQFEDIEDKAISVGEQSKVEANVVTVSHASIAFASKDISLLRVHLPTINNCVHPYAAYSKKPEYGPSMITVETSTPISTENNLIEKGSTFIQNGVKTEGDLDLDIAGMYERFEK